jgi:hypothetical protein
MTQKKQRYRVVGLASALIGAPVLVLAATALDRTGASDPLVYLQQVSADRGRYLAAGLLLAIGMMAFLPAAAGLTELSKHLERPTVLRVGAALLSFGALTSGAAVASGFAPSYVATEPGSPPVDPDLLDRLNTSPWAVLGFTGSAIGLGIGLVVTGAGLWRSGVIPRWAAGLCMATPLTFALPGDFSFDAAGWLLAAIPFALAASTLLQLSAREPDDAAVAVVSSD